MVFLTDLSCNGSFHIIDIKFVAQDQAKNIWSDPLIHQFDGFVTDLSSNGKKSSSENHNLFTETKLDSIMFYKSLVR